MPADADDGSPPGAPTERELPTFAGADLDPGQRELYDAIAAGPRSRGRQKFDLVAADGRLAGPFNAFLLRPEVGTHLERLGAAIRFGASLPDRWREIAILSVAAHWGCAFEQHAHESIGRSIGLTEAELLAIRAWAPESDAAFSDPADRLVIRIVRSLLTRGDVEDADFTAIADRVGTVGIFELTTLVGYYTTLAFQLEVFRVAPDVGH
jgi:4-carboxymuconolactone decarboxylase